MYALSIHYIANKCASPPSDRTSSLEDLALLADSQLALRPAAAVCARALDLGGVQTLLDLPTAVRLDRSVITEVWTALRQPQAKEAALLLGGPGEYISGELIASVLALLPYTGTKLHVPKREGLRQEDVHLLGQGNLRRPPAGTTHIALVVNNNKHYGALVLELMIGRPTQRVSPRTRATFYDSLQDGHYIPTTWVTEVSLALAVAMQVPPPSDVTRVTDSLQPDGVSCGVFSLMRVLCLAATGSASLPPVTGTAWADSCRTLLQASAYVSVGAASARTAEPCKVQAPPAALGRSQP